MYLSPSQHGRWCNYRILRCCLSNAGRRRTALELDIEIAFTPSLPTVQFQNLRKTVAEGEVFVVQPTIPINTGRASVPTSSEYFLWPADGWMNWDESTASFRGAVPAKMPIFIGAGKIRRLHTPAGADRATLHLACSLLHLTEQHDGSRVSHSHIIIHIFVRRAANHDRSLRSSRI